MYGEEGLVQKKTMHRGILQACLMSHSFVPNKTEGFVIK
jgi:hypothetical protein